MRSTFYITAASTMLLAVGCIAPGVDGDSEYSAQEMGDESSSVPLAAAGDDAAGEASPEQDAPAAGEQLREEAAEDALAALPPWELQGDPFIAFDSSVFDPAAIKHNPNVGGSSSGVFALSVTPRSWSSPYRGGPGGGPFEVSCASGEVAVGIYGRSGQYVDQIGLICAPIYEDGSFGPDDWRGSAGGGGGGSFVAKCPLNQAIGGIRGRSDLLLDQVQIMCYEVSGAVPVYTWAFGGNGGDAWADISPYRYFVTKIMGRSGSLVDGLQAVYHYIAP